MKAELREEAERREVSHANHKSNRNLADGKGCLKGLSGEYAFSLRYGLTVDVSPQLAGDGGTDFILDTDRGIFHVDVKTAAVPRWLLVESAKCRADTIYVLARFSEDAASLVGWEWGSVLMKGVPGDYGHRGIVSYAVEREKLRKMYELDSRVIR